MELFLAILIGIGLSISAGFRVFTPMLVASIASKLGWLPLSGGFEWIGSTPALIAFSVAVVIEIASYYVPVIDNFMKALATPLALIAGTILTVSMIGVEDNAFLSWGMAILTGGGAATASQLTTAAVRGTSTVTTGGLANPILSFIEDIGAVLLSIVSIALPIVVVVLVIILVIVFVKMFSIIKRRFRTA